MTSPISFRSSALPGQSQLTILLAHDLRSRACDHLIERVVSIAETERRPALARSVHLEELGSLEAGWLALDRAARLASPMRRALVLACLDLPPAPRAGATLAGWAISFGLPAVLVTHSRRWLPPGQNVLSALPALSPNADDDDIAGVLSSALAAPPSRQESGLWSKLALSGGATAGEQEEEAFPNRPSWLG